VAVVFGMTTGVEARMPVYVRPLWTEEQFAVRFSVAFGRAGALKETVTVQALGAVVAVVPG
jgi:hypothetical protein